ncbi:RNA polymerase sigma factor [Granulosicoccus antarcticus]|uniref:ECF RNA polymerase sigma factor SigM n=1 Tax=Granulosicoccus antarcticus IMCC3135 TaxID=1192854 RepID=A0A2Z2NQ75_9GAMM|nr:sigma-70 family RNA polymerase sigma factor [Granulosicoccus antarcticus]ASJ73532.1 ECF RNA polymerase sigma factor SigM [Granulosicoccus antarcticus IMCC3135]
MLAATSGSENYIALDQPIDIDVELVRAVADGDRKAFERLFRLYHSRIYKFSIRMLQDHLSADEVACDTLYAVWTSASKFREQSTVSSWILGIAYRRSLKSYNKNARHTENREPTYQMEELVESSPSVNPETYTNNAMEVGQMQKALSTLSSNHRAVMELIALGYSVTEIATIVGCPENTVKTRTFHARRQLRIALQD